VYSERRARGLFSSINSLNQTRNFFASRLGIGETALRRWVEQAEVEAGRGPEGALKRSEREELVELRRENRRLRLEREILKNFRMPRGGITCWTRNSAGDYC
jgi:transposase-like protein